jgi:ribulose kinase
MRDLALGIDVGTSGVRAAAVDADGCRAAFAAATMPAPFDENGLVTQHPAVWWKATRRVLQKLAQQIDLKRIGAIAVDGTSGTVLGLIRIEPDNRISRVVPDALTICQNQMTEVIERKGCVVGRRH